MGDLNKNWTWVELRQKAYVIDVKENPMHIYK